MDRSKPMVSFTKLDLITNTVEVTLGHHNEYSISAVKILGDFNDNAIDAIKMMGDFNGIKLCLVGPPDPGSNGSLPQLKPEGDAMGLFLYS